MSIKRKYVDSHWLVFAVKGITALLFGWFVNFSSVKDSSFLIFVAGSTLLGLGIIELFNLLHRTHMHNTWGLALLMSLIEIISALIIVFTLGHNLVLHLSIIAGYTLVRGVLEILIGIKSIDDRTDKAIWGISGICGAILGFVILRSGNLENVLSFIKFFGIYMIIVGIANLIYSLHNRDQSKSFKEEQQEKRAKKAASGASTKITAKSNIKPKTVTTKSIKSTSKTTVKTQRNRKSV